MPYTTEQLEILFNNIRFDWEDAYSPILAEGFIIFLN